MKPTFALLAAGLLLSAGTRVVTLVSHHQTTPPPSAPPSSSEQEWINSEIAASIWNIAGAATKTPGGIPAVRGVAGPAAPGVLASFTIEAAGSTQQVDIRDYIWSPAPFVPVAARLLGPGRDAALDATDVALLEALTSPRAEVIQAQNTRLSAAMRAHPRSAALHERAALLIGSLALRESAGAMSDPRLMMCRMSAHLATAQALDPDGTRVEGRLARTVLLALVNRQRDALASLDALPLAQLPAAVQAWDRALRLRATHDWRLVSRVEQSSLLEQRELLRATRVALGEGRAVDLIDRLGSDDIDWGRLLFHEAPTVGTGNRFADVAVAAEADEARRMRASYPAPPWLDDPRALVRELNVEPAAGPALGNDQFWIIDWGTWAAAAQRHMIAGMVCRNRHYWYMVDLPEKAAEIDRRSAAEYGELRLYPVAEVEMARNAKNRDAYAAAMAKAAALTRQRPDLVPDAVLTDLQEPAFGGHAAAVPPSAHWIAPYFPSGTAFDAHRAYRAGSSFRIDLSEAERLRVLAPFERTFINASLERRFGNLPPVATVGSDWGPLAPYDVSAANAIARASYSLPDVWVPTVRRIAETLNPDEYVDLGQYLAQRGRADEAEAAFGRYVEVASDPVAMSGHAWWLILRYFETGRRAQALALGARVADVYSGAGLAAYGGILDLTGDLTGSERAYRTILERYDNPTHLLAFFMRHPDRDGAGETKRLTARLFPSGLQPVDAPPAGAPAGGVLVSYAGLDGERSGVKKNDVIVAVDGIRVDNEPQYQALKARRWTAPMRLLLWRDHSYVQVETQLRHRWVKARLATYPDSSVDH